MRISVSPSVILMGLIFFISGEVRYMYVALLAALIHELGHLLFAFIYKIKIEGIEVNLFGALIKVSPLHCSYKKEACLSAAGPIANIGFAALILLFSKYASDNEYTELFILLSLFFALINLLPIESFDGGRITACILLSKFSPDTVFRIMEWLSLLCIFFLWSISVYFILKTGAYLSLFIFSGSLFCRICLAHRRKRD